MSSEKNIIKVYFKGTHLTHSKTQYQYNHGMILHFADLNLPQAFETHFANKQHGNSKTVIGSENKVEIPDEYFWTGANEIFAWVYLHSDVDDGETVYEVRIPLVKRAKPSDEEPLPEQQSAIDRAIAELSHAVETTNADAEQTNADREAVTALRDEVVDLRDEAEQSAQTATAKANEANESASSANESEQNAHNYADDAKRYAENAFSSKETAVASASDAEQAKEDAEQARDDVQGAKSDAIQIKQDVVRLKDDVTNLKDDVINLKDDVIDLKEQTDSNVTHYPKVIDEYWHVWNSSLGEYVNTNVKAQGDKGDKGDTYVLTEEDKEDIAGLVDIPIQIKYVKDDESDNGGVIEGSVNGDNINVASGYCSHAEGFSTLASSDNQHVQGKYNIADSQGMYVDIIGNGTSDNSRSNAYTLDWQGNGVYAGKITVGTAPTNDMDVATKKYVDDVKGASIHICSSEEYDSTTRIPTIQNPDEKTFYLVPSEDGTSPDLFVEWAYVNNAWEMFGSASIDLSGYLTDVTIGGNSVVTDGVANIPVATKTDLGVIKAGAGFQVLNDALVLKTAISLQLKQGIGDWVAITPHGQHEATFYGLAKASGDTTQSQSDNAVGTYTDEAKASIQNMLGVPSVDDIPDVPVEDVQINGASIVTDGVADIPVGNNNIYGVMRSNVNYGTTTYHTDSGDFLGITFATPNEIKNPNTYPHAIVPYYQDQATFYGLAKVSGDTTQASSSNAVGTYTDDAKASIQSMLGVPSTDDVVTDVQVNGTSITSDGVANLPIATKDNLGVIKRKLYSGVAIDADGSLRLELAGDTTIKNGVSTYTPIVPQHQHKSVFYGLAKAAGYDEKDSTLSIGQYTPEAKGAIQSMLGIDSLIAPTETNPFTDAHEVGDLFIINGTLYKAKTAIAVGDVLDDGVNVDAVNVNDVIIKDIQVNGTSVINNGVASVPIGTLTDFGVVKIGSGLGVNNGLVTTNPAVSSDIKAATANYKQIVPSKQHEAVFYGLATASGDTTQKNSSNAVGTYTDEAKASIQTMLGVPSSDDVVSDVQINGTSVVTDGIASIPVASTTGFGAVKIKEGSASGISINSEGLIYIYGAGNYYIKLGTNNYTPITPAYQHVSTFYGLAKASGDTTQSQSSNAVGTYTEEAKTAIRTMLGLEDVYEDYSSALTALGVI